MPREKEDFRDNLNRLTDRFPGKETIPLKSAAELVGATPDRLKTDDTFPIKRLGRQYVVPLVGLARWLS